VGNAWDDDGDDDDDGGDGDGDDDDDDDDDADGDDDDDLCVAFWQTSLLRYTEVKSSLYDGRPAMGKNMCRN